MLDLALKVSPLLLAFLAGLVLEQRRIVNKSHADLMLKIVIKVGLPLLILASISNIRLSAELGLLPLACMLTILCTWPLAVIAGHVLKLPRPTLGVMVIGPLMLNLAFVYPFVIVTFGAEGFALLALFDFGNALLMLTLVYVLSCWYGSEPSHWQRILKGMITFPPFLALLAALLLNVSGQAIPAAVNDSIINVGKIIMLLVPVALAIYLDTRLMFSSAALTAVGLRIGGGFLLGLLWIELFDLEGLTRVIVLIGSIAPVGFTCLVFAAQQKLDKEFAASLASTSLIISLILLPVMLYLLS